LLLGSGVLPPLLLESEDLLLVRLHRRGLVLLRDRDGVRGFHAHPPAVRPGHCRRETTPVSFRHASPQARSSLPRPPGQGLLSSVRPFDRSYSGSGRVRPCDQPPLTTRNGPPPPRVVVGAPRRSARGRPRRSYAGPA